MKSPQVSEGILISHSRTILINRQEKKKKSPGGSMDELSKFISQSCCEIDTILKCAIF